MDKGKKTDRKISVENSCYVLCMGSDCSLVVLKCCYIVITLCNFNGKTIQHTQSQHQECTTVERNLIASRISKQSERCTKHTCFATIVDPLHILLQSFCPLRLSLWFQNY